MGENEMKPKPGLPQNVRLSEGLGFTGDTKPGLQLLCELFFGEPSLLSEDTFLNIIELFTNRAAGDVLPEFGGWQEKYLVWMVRFARKCPSQILLKILRISCKNLRLKSIALAATEAQAAVIGLVILDLNKKQLRQRPVLTDEYDHSLLVAQRIDCRVACRDVLRDQLADARLEVTFARIRHGGKCEA